MLIASANRDERHWEDPDRFDMRRATVRHTAFSRGPHVCGIRLATKVVPYQGWVFRGPTRLDVTWRGRA